MYRENHFVFDVPTDCCHAGTIAQDREGTTWYAWFGGTREGAPDVDIYFSCSSGGGFAPIRKVSAGPEAHWNPVLLPREEGVTLFFKYGATIPGWRTMRVDIDPDGTFPSPPREVVPGDVGGRGPVKNKCLRLKSGRLLAPASIERQDPARWNPYVDISEDGGQTFSRLTPIPLLRPGDELPSDNFHPWCVARRAGAIQPTLWQDDSGAVHALMRSTEGFVLRSDSTDDGLTWCPAYRTSLPNNNSGIDLARLADGRLFLCMNPVSGDGAARTPLALFCSQDNGETFEEVMTLETDPGEYSYPSIVADGHMLTLIYTWNRRKMAVWRILPDPMSGGKEA